MLWLIASHIADTHRCSLNQSSLFLNNKHLIRNSPLFILECSACLTHNMSKSLTQDIRVMFSAPPLRPQIPTWWTATCGENELPLLLWQLFHLNKNHYKEETAAASVDTWTDATTPREGESGWNTDWSFLIHRQPAWCTYVCVCVQEGWTIAQGLSFPVGFAPFFIDSIKREVRRRTTEQHGDTALHATVFLVACLSFP